MSNRIVPCLWLDSQAQQAADFYLQVFPGSRLLATSHYPRSIDNPGGMPPGSVLTVELELMSQRFTALNGGPLFPLNPSLSFFVHADTSDQADRLFTALAQGGEVLMPLGAYPWSERYGWVKDRFGVSWQVITRQRVAGRSAIMPCLMFNGAQARRAEEAMRAYAEAFPRGQVESVTRYTAEEPTPGAVKHGRCSLDGQDLVAMDSPIDHGFSFNEALSLQVRCRDQAEVEHYWAALAQGGEHGRCGWLKDRFGVSWQVVPEALGDWLAAPDTAASERVFAAMLQMSRLDLAELQRAFEGR